MEPTRPPKPSRSGDSATRALIAEMRALTPEQRMLLALRLGRRCRIFARASPERR